MGAIGGVRNQVRPGADSSAPLSTGPRRRRGLRRVLTAVGVVGLAMAILVVGGIGFLRHRPATPPPALGLDPAGSLVDHPVVLSGSLQQAIASLQERLKVLPSDASSWATLGLAYVQEGRVTADPSYYPKADGALRRS